jgi:leader peptidase (prepilin peptidase) / N-methyltransferase
MSPLGWQIVIAVWCAMLGLIGGSYLGVLADRIPVGQPTSIGRSHCDSCGMTLRWFELVPVVSWLIQRGRCRTCHARVPVTSTLMELGTGGLSAGMAIRFGAHWELGGFLILAGGLVLLTVIDLRTQTLPRRIIYFVAATGVPFLIIGALRHHQAVRLQWALYGSLGAAAFFLLLYLGWRGSMGDGDVRLAALLGFFLGWIGPMHTPVGLFLGFFAGAIVGVVRMRRGAGVKTQLAFGPYMALGAISVVFVGHPLIRLWLRQ